MLAKYSRWSVRTLRDVRVQARLPAAIAGTAAELDDQLAAVGGAPGLLQAPRKPRLPADVGQIAAHALDVDRRAGDQEDGGSGLVHWGKTEGVVSCIGPTMLHRVSGVAIDGYIG